MKHIVKILTLLVAISALWIGLLQTSILPHGHTWLVSLHSIIFFLNSLYLFSSFYTHSGQLTLHVLSLQLPIYFIVSLGCYGLLMVGIGLMTFPTCPAEGLLLQKVLLPLYSYLHFHIIQQRAPSSLSFFSGMFSKFPYPMYY